MTAGLTLNTLNKQFHQYNMRTMCTKLTITIFKQDLTAYTIHRVKTSKKNYDEKKRVKSAVVIIFLSVDIEHKGTSYSIISL